mgnify:CR=1 FL=1
MTPQRPRKSVQDHPKSTLSPTQLSRRIRRASRGLWVHPDCSNRPRKGLLDASNSPQKDTKTDVKTIFAKITDEIVCLRQEHGLNETRTPKVRENSVQNNATTRIAGPQLKWLCRTLIKHADVFNTLPHMLIAPADTRETSRLLRCSYSSRVAPSKCPHRNSFITKTVGYPAKRVIHGCSANACFSKRWMQVTIAERNTFENASWQINTARIFAGPFPRMQANGPATYVQHK